VRKYHKKKLSHVFRDVLAIGLNLGSLRVFGLLRRVGDGEEEQDRVARLRDHGEEIGVEAEDVVEAHLFG